MTKIQEYLQSLPEEKKKMIDNAFGNVEKFYKTIYTLARSEHQIDQQKPDRYEDRLATIREIKKRIEGLLDSFGLDGKEVVADIASDYFEDYVQYKEESDPMEQQEFIEIIKKVTNQQ